VPVSQPARVLPLRPLTLGELLDAAVMLLREHAWVYLSVAALLAAGEQAALYPLHTSFGVGPLWNVIYDQQWGKHWLQFGVERGSEMTIIVWLGGLTARAAVPALAGQRLTTRRLLTPAGSRFVAVTVAGLFVGLVAAASALAGMLPWLFAYGLLGLVAPAIVIGRLNPAPAVIRSVVLAGRIGARAMWIRLGGYLGWLLISLALRLAVEAVTGRLSGSVPELALTLAVLVATALANAVSYATLACLDAVLYLETLMRTEALDITLGRRFRMSHEALR
jgi:hypothetical protein